MQRHEPEVAGVLPVVDLIEHRLQRLDGDVLDRPHEVGFAVGLAEIGADARRVRRMFSGGGERQVVVDAGLPDGLVDQTGRTGCDDRCSSRAERHDRGPSYRQWTCRTVLSPAPGRCRAYRSSATPHHPSRSNSPATTAAVAPAPAMRNRRRLNVPISAFLGFGCRFIRATLETGRGLHAGTRGHLRARRSSVCAAMWVDKCRPTRQDTVLDTGGDGWTRADHESALVFSPYVAALADQTARGRIDGQTAPAVGVARLGGSLGLHEALRASRVGRRHGRGGDQCRTEHPVRSPDRDRDSGRWRRPAVRWRCTVDLVRRRPSRTSRRGSCSGDAALDQTSRSRSRPPWVSPACACPQVSPRATSRSR